jgi:Cof subfamily protein (haloacid dehalogenase superfamily)
MQSYKNIVLLTDLDGTLLDSGSRVSNKNKEAIETFINGGGKFGIATGRGERNALKFIDDVKANIPCILYNGCGLYNYNENKYLELKLLTNEKLKSLLEDCMMNFPKVVIQIYSTIGCLIITPEELIDDDIRMHHSPFINCKLEEIMDKEWIKILFRGDKEELGNIEKYLNNMNIKDDITVVYSSDIYLEILPSRASKGDMLLTLRNLIGEEHTYYAVGDYYNDVEMIRVADVGMATYNAPDDVKKVADIVTVSNDNDVLADIIYNIMNKDYNKRNLT